MSQRFDELEDWAEAESWTDAEGWVEPVTTYVLKEVLHDGYGGADDEAYDEAFEAVLDGMSAAEAFSFQKALQQIGGGASTVLSAPVVGQVAQTALPVGAGALGTLIGGPAGTAIGSRLGTLAAGAVAGKPAPPRPAVPVAVAAPVVPGVAPVAASALVPVAPAILGPGPGVPVPAVPAPAVAGGSAAAAQGLVLTQQPDVLKALLALSMGQHGARQVGGVPVASVMNLLSSVFGQAAADADELHYLDSPDQVGDPFDEEATEPELGSGRALYTALMDVENEELVS